MKAGCRSGLILAGLLWANLAAAQTRVDPGSSHVPIPPRPGQPDLEKIFEERFGRAMAMDELARILEKLFPEKTREQLLHELKNSPIDWNDPKLRQQLAELSKHPDLLKDVLKPDEIEKLKQQFREKLPNVRPPIGTDLWPPVVNPPMPNIPELPAIPDLPADEQQAREDAEEVMRWLGRHLEGLADHIDDSPELRRLLRDLGEGLLANGGGDAGGEGLEQQLARWNRWARDTKSWLEPVLSPFKELEMPRLGWGGGGNVGQFVPRARQVRETAAFWPVVAWVIGIGLVLWAAWKLGVPKLHSLGVVSSWRLGPWPVRPETVSNRQELIQTFEYLSLLRFGQPAQCWNHREIARRLDRAEGDRLAGLYEQARYAPEEEPLSSEQLARAREDLCELAHT